jgi:hypothetical protein
MQDTKDSVQNIQEYIAKMQERYIMGDIREKYNKKEYAWYGFRG